MLYYSKYSVGWRVHLVKHVYQVRIQHMPLNGRDRDTFSLHLFFPIYFLYRATLASIGLAY